MSIVEVAKLAGVSHTTVSRVINHRPGVSDDVVQKVRRAMSQLNYTPPVRRRGPQPRGPGGLRTRTIAALLVGADIGLSRVPLIAELLHCIERALTDRNLAMTFGQVLDEGQMPPNVSNLSVDGLLLLGQTPHSAALRRRLEMIPTVWLLTRRGLEEDWGDRVQPNNEATGRLAAEYLLERGHGHLIFINPTPEHPAFAARGNTFVRVARQRGATADIIELNVHNDSNRLLSIQDEMDQQLMEQAIDQLLSRSPRPTGLFVPNDAATATAQLTLVRRGIRPGKDIEIVSCNNDNSSLVGLDPRPASIDLRPDLIGQRAVDQLLRAIHNPFGPVRTQLLVEPRLVSPEEMSSTPKSNGSE